MTPQNEILSVKLELKRYLVEAKLFDIYNDIDSLDNLENVFAERIVNMLQNGTPLINFEKKNMKTNVDGMS